MKTIKFQLEELTCPSCINKIESVLNRENGVQSAKVLFNSSKVKVEYKEGKIDPEKIASLIEKMGYPVLSPRSV